LEGLARDTCDTWLGRYEGGIKLICGGIIRYAEGSTTSSCGCIIIVTSGGNRLAGKVGGGRIGDVRKDSSLMPGKAGSVLMGLSSNADVCRDDRRCCAWNSRIAFVMVSVVPGTVPGCSGGGIVEFVVFVGGDMVNVEVGV